MGFIGRLVYSWKSSKGVAERFYTIKEMNNNWVSVSKKKKKTMWRRYYYFTFDMHVRYK